MNLKLSMRPLALMCMIGVSLFSTAICEGKSCKKRLRTRADYIIIGAGTAGSVLAEQLSQNFSVIVIEAGENQDGNSLVTDPLASGGLVLNNTNLLFWGLGHTPIENISPPPENQRRWPAVAGELFGGGSSVNGMQDVRGTRVFFEEWQAAAGGDPAWGPDNSVEVYKNMETFVGVPGQFDPAIHGTSGPVGIRQCIRNLQASQVFETAVTTVTGVPAITDYNDLDAQIGPFLYWQLFQKLNPVTGLIQRTSASIAYLDPIITPASSNTWVSQNGNLLIYTKAKALRLLFNGNTASPRAIGVLTDVNGDQTVFRARKDIIVCAGFQSCLLLQLSGIGDASYLSGLGIPIVYNNPNVGNHAHNHPGVTLTGINGTIPAAVTPDLPALYDGAAFLPYPVESTTDRAFELIGIASPGTGTGTYTIASLILNPHSVGFVSLYNSDPSRMPFYDFATYEDTRDQDAAIYIYTQMWDILTNMGFVTFASGAPNPHTATRAQILNYIEGFVGAFQNYHYQSMCIMSTDPSTGVVDPNCRVFGVRGLRVADDSIIPTNSRGNTSAPAYLIGNVLASKILAGN